MPSTRSMPLWSLPAMSRGQANTLFSPVEPCTSMTPMAMRLSLFARHRRGYQPANARPGGFMDNHAPAARAAIVAGARWESALQQAIEQTSDLKHVDVAILFASSFYAASFQEMLARLRQDTGAAIVVGCSGQAIIGQDLELEDVPALSLLTLSLPGAVLRPVRFTQAMIETCETPLAWRDCLDIRLNDVNAWLIFADPFRIE